MLGLCCDEPYSVMTNHDDGDDDGDNDGNDDDNAASGSGSDGPIFDPTATLGHALVSRRRIGRRRRRRCGCGAICIYALKCIYPINTL